ncbi:hypothetical protein Clacol_005384 [Clathrus columnatus]|uniref:Ribosomal RNA-processing protein 4 n=1 Tax=Clathrus columnatus TaxID=1419009 RepID=A0AAV5ADE8_9AGAM|nr:hypothetical protein Clacol_005384 [Clathrus columnatus]
MFKIASFPPRVQHSITAVKHHPDVEADVLMDLDEIDDEVTTKISSPGESLTSASAFMRYTPEMADLVVGRITEVKPILYYVLPRKWKVDVNSRQDAVLHLASVNLPGGVQRRKLESDELQMRTFFEDGDLLVAEVQGISADGSMQLHTRTLKFGKASLNKRNGQLVTVPPILVRRLKSQFYALPCGVDLILGLNGYIWVSKHTREQEQEGEVGFDAEAVYSNKNDVIDTATRIAIARVTNIIRILARFFIPITDSILIGAYEWVLDQECDVKDLLQDENAEALVTAIMSQT